MDRKHFGFLGQMIDSSPFNAAAWPKCGILGCLKFLEHLCVGLGYLIGAAWIKKWIKIRGIAVENEPNIYIADKSVKLGRDVFFGIPIRKQFGPT